MNQRLSSSDEFLAISSPEDAGLVPDRWNRVLSLAQKLTQTELPGLAFQVSIRGKSAGEYQFGRQSPSPSAPPLRSNSIFLSASITKPIVAMAALLLVERGELSLGDSVAEFVPLLANAPAKKTITIRHLLTHTSGLPDQLPNNRALRMTKSPLSTFVEGACEVGLEFPPGRGVQYQSMGFVLLGAVIEAITRMKLPVFLDREIFGPLHMKDTTLGAPDRWFSEERFQDRLAIVDMPDEQRGGDDWNWNSRYWLQLGAPWGGLLTTTGDLIRFCQVMLDGGTNGLVKLFSYSSIQAAVSNQLTTYPDVPEADRRCRGWGFGWRLNWPTHSATFGDLLGPRTYGHWGATGTLLWVDPDRQAAAAILSTLPLDKGSGPALAKLSNAIVAAIR